MENGGEGMGKRKEGEGKGKRREEGRKGNLREKMGEKKIKEGEERGGEVSQYWMSEWNGGVHSPQ